MLPTAVKLPAGVEVGDGAEGDEGEGEEAVGVADVEGFAHPVGRNSRPKERANTIQENQRCFRNCDFMARSPNKLVAYGRMLTVIAN
jgi:hypothetical protein